MLLIQILRCLGKDPLLKQFRASHIYSSINSKSRRKIPSTAIKNRFTSYYFLLEIKNNTHVVPI